MRPLAWLLWLAVGVSTAVPAEAIRPWILPPIDGTLSGEFVPVMLAGAPPLKWKLEVAAQRVRERAVAAEVEGPGLKVRLAAVVDPCGEGSWRVSDATLELGEWFGWVADRFAPQLAGATVKGTLAVRGEGTWRGGALGGKAEVELRDGLYDEPVKKVVVNGLALQVRLADIAARRSEGAQVLSWESGHFDTIAFDAGRVEFALEGDRIRIHNTVLAIFGGELRIGELVLSTKGEPVSVAAQVRGIDLDKVLFLLPKMLASAEGHLDGELALQISVNGIRIGTGRLGLPAGETATIRLIPSPGLLSAQLPPTVRRQYPGLEAMEKGGIPLRADSLEITLTPSGDADGRTAAVRLAGGPADPSLTAPVTMQFNVRGPLDSLLKFATDKRLRVGGSH